jgi:ABC-type glycerol-3-phosphate transport system substrate-binding protein
MKNAKIKIIILCIATISFMLFSGCEKTETEQPNVEGYIETEISFPENIAIAYDMSILPDNTIRLLGYNEDYSVGTIWDSVDNGESWNAVTEFTENIPIDQTKEFQRSGYLSTTGEILDIVSYWENEMNVDNKYYLVNDKNVTEINIDMPDIHEANDSTIKNAVCRVEFSQNGDIFAEDLNGQIYQIDSTSGEITKEYLPDDELGKILDFCMGEESIIILTEDNVLEYQTQSGEEIELDNLLSQFKKYIIDSDQHDSFMREEFSVQFDGKEAKKILCMNDDGITLFANGKEEKLIEGTHTCMASMSTTIYALQASTDDKIFCIAQTDVGSKLYCYEPTQINKSESKTISFYTLNENRDFNEVIAQYQRKHPDINIEIQVGIKRDHEIPISDALRTLNTDILSGNGPDLICLDGIALQNYANNGLLLDITNDINSIVNEGEVLGNVISAYKTSGKIYAMPAKFSLPVVVGNKQLIDNSHDFTTLISGITDYHENDNFLQKFNQEYFGNMSHLLYRSFVSTKVDNGDKLTAKDIQSYYAETKKMLNLCESADIALSDDESFRIGTKPMTINEFPELVDGQYNMAMSYVMNFEDFQCLYTVKDKSNMDFGLLGTQDSNLFAPQDVVGINANTKYKDIATDFIKFLLSENAQVSIGHFGMPVNIAAIEQRFENIEETEVTFGDNNKTVNLKALTDTERKAVMNLFKSIDTPMNTDLILMDIVQEYQYQYLKGDIDIDSARDEAMKKINLYLSE